MRSRTLTIASFFSVAMAATLLGALFTTQVRRPVPARASSTATPAATPAAPPVRAGSASDALGLETFRDIARANNAGVVNINTSKIVKLPPYRDPFRDFFGDGMMDRFFGPGPDSGRSERRQTQTSLGSGFVIDPEGYVLTNRHVIEGADEISVTFPDGKRYDAKVVGRDARTDVALIKIDARETLTPLVLGDSDRLEVGEWVMAIGNPFGLGGNSVTVGVVSFKGRSLPLGVRNTTVDMIQTDAAINPGNSGGPLLNTRGEVVGINTMIVTDGFSRANAGVGFSVPVNVAKEILGQLREKGRVIRGWMGVTIETMREDLAKTYGLQEAKGAVITSVAPGSPADKAGLLPEDVVLGADGRTIQDNGDLSRYVSSKAPGTVVVLDVLRKGGHKEVRVTLGTFRDETTDVASSEQGHARLGMTLRDLTPELAERLDLPAGSSGALVTEVEPGGAAEDAGLNARDVIVSVNGTPVRDVGSFEQAIDAASKDGNLARLRVLNAQGARIYVLRLK